MSGYLSEVVHATAQIVTAVGQPVLLTEALRTYGPVYISTVNTGFPGPPGAASNLYYQHDQLVAAATWIINHNLGTRPNVAVYTTGGLEVWAEVLHLTANQAQVLLDVPMAGFALCT